MLRLTVILQTITSTLSQITCLNPKYLQKSSIYMHNSLHIILCSHPEAWFFLYDLLGIIYNKLYQISHILPQQFLYTRQTLIDKVNKSGLPGD